MLSFNVMVKVLDRSFEVIKFELLLRNNKKPTGLLCSTL